MTIDWEVFWTSFLLAALGVIAWRLAGRYWDRERQRDTQATRQWLEKQAKKESDDDPY